jgi:hypothetical protein
MLGCVERDMLHSDAFERLFNGCVVWQPAFASRKPPRFRKWPARDVDRAARFTVQSLCQLKHGEQPRLHMHWPVRRLAIDANHLAFVAVDGHLRFQRLDQIERGENVLHGVVVSRGGELYFKFARHRATTNAYEK